MSKLDEQFEYKAQEIEKDIIKLCNLRQIDKSISKEAFQKQYSVDIKQREHIEHKYNLDVRTKIYEFLMNHPKWKNRLDGIKVMDVFDECLKKYKPQGSYFLSLFMSQYSLRMQDTRNDSYIDEKDSVFNYADSINIDTNGDEKVSKRKSSIDEQSKQNFFNDMLSDYSYLYETVNKELSQDLRPYLKYFVTVNALLTGYSDDSIDDSYIDREFFFAQSTLTDKYMQEYEQETALGKNKQIKAFLKGRYFAAVADIFDLSPDYTRKIFKKIQNEITRIGMQLHLS